MLSDLLYVSQLPKIKLKLISEEKTRRYVNVFKMEDKNNLLFLSSKIIPFKNNVTWADSMARWVALGRQNSGTSDKNLYFGVR